MATMLNPNAIPDGSITQEKIESSVLSSKQDTIPDLDAIRQGAQKGSTALQSESDPVYLADKPKLALKVEIPDVSGKVDKVTGKGLSSNDYTDADKLKLTGLENYDDTQVRELIVGKANLQHQHTVADITDFPELYYDATAFFTSGSYPSDRYEELLEAVKAEKTVYATIDEEGYVSYVFFMSSANSYDSSSRVLLTTIFADGSNLYLNTFVLQQSGMTSLQESITSKANKATTLAGYGIGDAYTKSEVDAFIDGKQDKTSLVSDLATKVNALSSSDKAAFLGQIGAADKTAFETHNNDSTRHITAAERTAWNAKQGALTAGFGISISGGEISSTLDTNPFIVVSSLPSSGVKDKIYIAPSKNPETGNLTDEWIWNGSAWELLGASKVDLSDYATELWVENKGYLTEHQDISGKADVSYVDNKISTLTNVVNGKQDNISDLTAIRNGAALGSTAIQEETDPTVPAWAKAEKKPSYTPLEIGAASQEALQSHTTDTVVHITNTERANWNAKQDTISDLAAIRSGASKGATALQKVPAEYITETELEDMGFATTTQVGKKQDIITDLADIRSGAAKGATALQSYTETDPIYLKDKPNIALKSEIPDISGKANVSDLTAHTGNTGIHVTTSDKSTWNSKQDAISDLDDIREGAALGKTALQEHQDISGKADKSSLAAVATSGSYNDLSNKPTIPSEQVNADWNATSGKAQILNKPTIPSAVTESTVSGWGFTKNTGTYSKPSTGIPKSDLESAVQTSLGKADTALQSYTEQYKGTITGVSANGTSVATSGVANIPAASTSVYGVTKLSSATNSTSTSLAATASAVKAAYDLANSYKGTVTGVKINGTTKNPSSGVVDLGTVITDISGKQDKLVSGTNIKTINGTSILGSGNIEISGGSSSGGGAYPEVNHGTSDTTFTLTPNTFHVWDEVTSLTLTFGSETSGVANEYLFQFTSGSTATSLTLPDDIKWANDNAPTIGVNMIYQISILRGLASVLEFNNAIVFPTIGDTGGQPNEEYAKVYEYFVTTYNLTSTYDSPSNGVAITETLICNDATYGGPVLKVSLNGTRLLLWTQNAINGLYVPSINSSGVYSLYFWD